MIESFLIKIAVTSGAGVEVFSGDTGILTNSTIQGFLIAIVTTIGASIVSKKTQKTNDERCNREFDINLILNLVDKELISPVFVHVFNPSSFYYNFDEMYKGIDQLANSFLTDDEKEKYQYSVSEEKVDCKGNICGEGSGVKYFEVKIGSGFAEKPTPIIKNTYKVIADFQLINSLVKSEKYKNFFGAIASDFTKEIAKQDKSNNSIIDDFTKMQQIDSSFKNINIKESDVEKVKNLTTEKKKILCGYINNIYLSRYIKNVYSRHIEKLDEEQKGHLWGKTKEKLQK